VARSRLSGHIQPSKSVYFTLYNGRVSHYRQWYNYITMELLSKTDIQNGREGKSKLCKQDIGSTVV